ncbi:hypothetical protein HHK36_001972 [Tetracentron sinense]|uniref:Uncharacterized protein n=1 Tax=Tetracentron sinense TaxID=13715 RepID=A0A835DV97_TETSI|nr:hypothetical protein HHK36_001972 [Tetracentron sinense]
MRQRIGNAVLQSWDPTLVNPSRAGTTKMRRHVHGREFCVPESETPSRPIRNAVLQSWDPTLVNPSISSYSTLPIVDENHSSSPSLPSVVPIGAPWQQVFLLARRQKKIYVEVFDLAPIKLTLSTAFQTDSVVSVPSGFKYDINYQPPMEAEYNPSSKDDVENQQQAPREKSFDGDSESISPITTRGTAVDE